MIHKTKFFVALTLVGVVTSMVSAGQVAIIPTVSARFDNATNFNPLPFTSPGAGPITDGPGLYQIDLSIHTTNLNANERGFASLAFDVLFGAGQSVGFDYAPDSEQVDSNGTLPGGLVAKWTTNTDAGVAGDYQGILLAGPGALSASCGGANCPDPRGTLGDPAPEFFGSLYVTVTATSTLGFGNYQFSLRDMDSGQFNSPQDGTIPSIVFNFGGPGENTPPVGMDDSLLGVTAGADLSLQFLATDAEDPVNALIWSNFAFNGVPGFGGTGVHANSPVFNADGSFTWNTLGSARGTYTASATVTDTGGLTSSANFVVTITAVPEPTTLGLAGLAMIGLVGLFRRRS